MSLSLIILLRILHVVGGVAWAGATFFLAALVVPAVEVMGQDGGPDGGKFMQALTTRTRFNAYMAASAGITVVAGLLLYWNRSDGLTGPWMRSGEGITLTIGGLAALAQFVLGFAVTNPTSGRMARLGQEIMSAGSPPQPAQLAEMGRLQQTLTKIGTIGAILLVVAVLAMAIAQYL